MGDRAWFCAPLRRDNPRALARGLSTVQAPQTMLYLTCTTITSEDLAHYGVSRAKDWVSVKCGTRKYFSIRGSERYLPLKMTNIA